MLLMVSRQGRFMTHRPRYGCAISHHLRVFCLLCMLRIRRPAILTISLMMLHSTFTHRIRKSMVKVSC